MVNKQTPYLIVRVVNYISYTKVGLFARNHALGVFGFC